jgi:hypothetical protein
VTLRELDPAETANVVLAHPLGVLVLRQSVVPLGITLERFGAGRPAEPGPYAIATFGVGTATIPFQDDHELRDVFAPGQFLDLSESEKLTRPAFESFRCGQARIGFDGSSGGAATGALQVAAFDYDVTIIDARDERRSRSSRNEADGIAAGAVSDGALLRASAYGAASRTAGRSVGSSTYAGPKQGIAVRGASYAVAGTDDLLAASEERYATYTEAEAARRGRLDQDRGGARDRGQVVEAHEVA